LAYAGGKDYVVVGTGKLLDNPDINDITTTHTVYAIVETLESPAKTGKSAVYANLRDDLVRYNMKDDNTLECVGPAAECDKDVKKDPPHPNGWLVDFPSRKEDKTGLLGVEHVNLDIQISPNNNVIVATSQPKAGTCSDTALGRVHSFSIKASNLKKREKTKEVDEGVYIVDVELFVPDGPGPWDGKCDVGDVCIAITRSDGKVDYERDTGEYPSPDSRMSWRELTVPAP